MKQKLFILAAAVAALASCSNEEIASVEQSQAKTSANAITFVPMVNGITRSMSTPTLVADVNSFFIANLGFHVNAMNAGTTTPYFSNATFRYDNGTPNSTPTLCRLGEVYTVKIGVTRTCDNDWNNYPIISGIYAGQTGSGVRYPYDNLRYCSDGSTFTKWWYYQHLQSWNNMGTVNNGSYTYSTFGPIHTYLQRPEEGYDYRYVTSNACLNGNVTLNGSSKWVISSTNTINIKFAYFTTLYTFRRQLFDNILIPAVLNGEDILLDTRHRRYYTPTTSGEYSYMPQHVVNF